MRSTPTITDPATTLVRTGLKFFPPAKRMLEAGLAEVGIPAGVLPYVNYPTHFDSTNTQAALAGSGIAVPPLETYADRSGTTGSATSTPISSRTARFPARCGARSC